MVPEVPALFREIAKSLSAEGLKPAAAACNRLLDSIKKEGGNDSVHKKLVSALDAVPVDTMARVVAGLQPAALRVLLGLSDNMEDAFLRARLVPELALKMLEAADVGPLLGAMYGPVLDYSSDDEDAEAAEGLASMILTRTDGGASGGKAKAAAKGNVGAKDKSESQGPPEEEGGGEGEPWFCGAARLGHLGVLRKAVAATATKPSQEQLAAALRAAVLCGRRDAYRLLLDECGAPADAVDIARDLMAIATGSTGCSSAAAGGAAGGAAPAAAALRWRRLQRDRVGQAVQLLVAIARERGQLSQVGPELILSALAAAAQALQPEAVRALAATAHGAVAAGGGDGEEAVAGAATALLWELVCGGAGAGQPLGMRGGIDDDSAAKAAAGGGAEDGDEEDQGPGEDGEMPEDAALSPQFATYKALVAAGGARVRLSLAQLRELQARPGAAAALAALPGDELVRVAAAGGGGGGGAPGDTQPLEAAAGKGAEPWASDVASVAALAGLREAGGGKEGPAAAAAAAAIAAASTELSWAEVPLLQSPAAAPQAAAAAAPAAKKRKTDTAAAAAVAAGVEAEPADGVHVLLAAAHVGNAAACLFFLTGDGDDEERHLDEDEDEEPEEEEEKEKQRGLALPEEARPRPGEVVQAVQVAARRGGGGAASGCWRLVDMLVGRLLCQVMMDQIMQVTGGGGDGGGSDDDASDGEGKKRRRGAEAAGGSGIGSSVADMIASNPNLKLLCHVVSGDGASAGDIMAGRAGHDDDDDEGEEGEEGEKEKEKEEKEAAAADVVPASSYWVARALQLAASRGDVGRVVELMAGIEVRCRQEREQQQKESKEGEEGAGGEAALTWGQAVLGRGVLAALRTAVGALAGARRLRAPEERRARLLGGRKVVQVLAHASGRQPAAAVAEGAAEVRAAVAAAHAELHYACKAARERHSSTAAAASSAAGADGSSAVQLCGFRWGAVAPAVREAIEEGRSEAVGGGGVGGKEAGGLWESWESSEEAEEYGDEEAEEESDEEMEMGEGESGSGSGLSGEESDGEEDE